MKNFKINLIFVAILSFFLSCSNDTTESEVSSDAIQVDKFKVLDVPVAETEESNREALPVLEVRCINSCDGGEECGMFWDTSAGIIECSCTGCSMQLTYNEINRVNDALDYISEDVEAYFTREYSAQVEDVLFSSFIMSEHELDEEELSMAIVVEINFKIIDTEEIGSVFYVIKEDNQGSKVANIEVDCRGACASQSETCRERFISSSGYVECTCAGDNCTMHIIQN